MVAQELTHQDHRLFRSSSHTKWDSYERRVGVVPCPRPRLDTIRFLGNEYRLRILLGCHNNQGC